MFIRKKGNRFYLVENQRTNGKIKQRVIKYLGVNPTTENEYLPKLNIIYNDTAENILTKLPANSIDCIIADPPYFISYNRTFTRKEKDLNRNFGKWDQGDYQTFFNSWLPDCFRVLKHNLFLFTKFELIQYFAEAYPTYYKSALVWHKTNPAPHFQKNTFISACEPIIFFQKQKGLFNFLSVNDMHNHIETPTEQRKKIRFHPTQKHEQVIKWLLQIGSKPNSLILDLFSGSGTTASVARQMERNFIGVENDFSYTRKSRERIKSPPVVPQEKKQLIDI
ncbi:MAG: site-specific DNA-methyltransferase [Bacteroidales bacterium]|nr:site-specific DNA-methyltransferase [Bacteroidales bacterium]